MELADLVVVNKADGDLKPAAERTRADYAGALRLLRRRPGDPENIPAAMAISALRAQGVEDVWERVCALDGWRRESGWRDRRRREQAVRAFEAEVERGALDALRHHPQVAANWGALELAVANGQTTPEGAAADILALFLGDASAAGA
jgi:LAO/AO transport system kinase